MYAMIATWRMALDGVSQGNALLAQGSSAGDALESAIRMVEDNVNYTSVGYGGLPNAQMQVELDAGFMNGDDLSIGAVGGIHDFASPLSCIPNATILVVLNWLILIQIAFRSFLCNHASRAATLRVISSCGRGADNGCCSSCAHSWLAICIPRLEQLLFS